MSINLVLLKCFDRYTLSFHLLYTLCNCLVEDDLCGPSELFLDTSLL